MIKFEKYVNLRENENINKNLAIFDLDSTLLRTPEKPKNWAASGLKDFWGSAASLTPPLYNGEENTEVIKAFKKAKADPNTKTIVLTGRRTISAANVRNILRAKGLYGKRIIGIDNIPEQERFKKEIESKYDIEHPNENLPDAHEEYYTGSFTGKNETLAHKRHVIEKLLNDEKYTRVLLWDDRVDHLAIFKKVAEEYKRNGLIKEFIIHQVFPPLKPDEKAVIHVSSLQDDGSWK